MRATSSVEEALREAGLEVPQPRCVLLVDDEPDNLAVLEAVLEDTCEVLTAERAAGALDLLERGQPVDVLIADQRMPEMTGVELLSRVARDRPAIVRMVLTAYTDVEPMIEAINRGDVYRFLIKPCDPRELRAVVADALRLKWTQTALQQLVAALASQNRSLYDTHLRLAAAQEQLLQRTRLATLGRLATGIAHDVRNCSAIISLLVQYLRSKTTGVDARTLSMAQEMLDGSRPLLDLLDHVRRLARTSETRQQVRVSALFAEVVHSLRRGPGPVPDVSVDLAPDDASVLLDTEAMHQTLLAVLRGMARGSAPTAPLRLALGRDEPQPGQRPELWLEVHGPGAGPGKEPLELRLARITAEAQGARLLCQRGEAGALTARIVLPGAGPDPAVERAADAENLRC